MSKNYFLKGGIILAAIAVVLEILFLRICTDNLACIGLNLVLLSPGLFISRAVGAGANISINIFGNIIIYFIIGGVIGLIVEKIKNK